MYFECLQSDITSCRSQSQTYMYMFADVMPTYWVTVLCPKDVSRDCENDLYQEVMAFWNGNIQEPCALFKHLLFNFPAVVQHLMSTLIFKISVGLSFDSVVTYSSNRDLPLRLN